MQPLFQTPDSARIAIANKPLLLGGTVTYITPAEFKQQFRCDFTRSLWGDGLRVAQYAGLARRIATNNLTGLDSLQLAVIHRLANPLNNLVIGKISDRVGWGLFPQSDIPANTVFDIYSGEAVLSSLQRTKSAYAFGLSKSLDMSMGIDLIDAERRGNLMRFMQHLPIDYHARCRAHMLRELAKLKEKPAQIDQFLTRIRLQYEEQGENDPELANIQFMSDSTGVPQHVATANVEPLFCEIDGVKLLVMRSHCPIKAGEMLGFSYGSHYWEYKECSPELFTRKGGLLSHDSYKRTFAKLFVDEPGQKKPILMQDKTENFIKSVLLNAPVRSSLDDGHTLYTSIYDVRDQLVAANAVTPNFGFRPGPFPGVGALVHSLGKQGVPNVKVKAYFRLDGQNGMVHLTGAVEIVCRLPTTIDNYAAMFSSLASYLKGCYKDVNIFETTGEIVVS